MRQNHGARSLGFYRTQDLKKPTGETEFVEVLFLQNAVLMGWLRCGEQMLV